MKKIKKNLFKVITLVGTRPELIKLSCVIKKLDKYFKHYLIHTGQNYDYNLNEIFFKDLNIRKPDYFLKIKSQTASQAISKVIASTDNIIKKIKPDAFVVYGDTNSCLSALAAKKNNIPIFHMEAGNRCFDDRVPEEVNRRLIDHISDINLVLSEHARRNLINEGIKVDNIFKTGSHMFEVIEKNINKIKNSLILKKLGINHKKYFLISLHREENVDNKDKLQKLINMIDDIKRNYKNYKIIFSTHPRTQKNIKNFKIKINKNNINFLKPFNFSDYCNLQKNSYCTISDSGTIFEEASILKFPAITLRDAHERLEGIDSGSVVLSNYNDKNFFNKIELSINEFDKQTYTEDYNYNNVSSKVVKIISGYINFVNNKTYYKEI
jgi:UDP-N-acetylglucosamine 2-epimerase